MKYSVQFLLLFSLALGTPGYSHASWSSDDIKKAGIVAAGVAALLYLFGGSSETGQGDMYPSDYGFDDFSYSENERGSSHSDFFVQQKRSASQQSEPLINLSSLLCLGVLSYFGYNYLKNDDAQSNDATEKKTESAQNKNRESQAPVQEKKQNTNPAFEWAKDQEVQAQAQQTLWQHVKSSAWQQITFMNVIYVVGALAICSVARSIKTSCENPNAQQAPLYKNIVRYEQGANALCETICENINGFKERGQLTEQQAYALTTYATNLSEEVRGYYNDAKERACEYFGCKFQSKVSPADMARLCRYESRAWDCYRELEKLEKVSRSGLRASSAANELIERFEPEGVVLTEQIELSTKTRSGENQDGIEAGREHEQGVETTKRAEGEPLEKDSIEKKAPNELIDVKNEEAAGEKVSQSDSSQFTLKENAETKTSESEDDIVKVKKSKSARSLNYNYSYTEDYDYKDMEDMQNEMRMDSLHD